MVDDDGGSQAGVDDGGVGGPGAPTPLSALEVSDFRSPGYRALGLTILTCLGRCWTLKTRYSAFH